MIATRREKQMIKIVFLFFLFGTLLGASAEQTSPHKDLNLSCGTCHSDSALTWQQVHFDHSTTNFELNGMHGRLECRACHSIEHFNSINDRCNFCHEDVHQSRLTQDCQRCHTSTDWTVFDVYAIHSETSLQLLGRHAQLDCFSCHRGELDNRFLMVESSCSSCHLADYQATQSPQHSQLGFGTACNQCHAFTDWKPARFSAHDSYFPINSGAHSSVWDDCTTCHQTAGNYTNFSCIHCHAHRQSKMDSRHRGKRDYVYDSTACYACHSNGRGD